MKLFRTIILVAIMVAGAWLPFSLAISIVSSNPWTWLEGILPVVPFVSLPVSIYMEMRRGSMSKWSLALDIATLISLVAFDCIMEFVPLGCFWGG